MKNLTAAVLLSGAAFVSLSSAETPASPAPSDAKRSSGSTHQCRDQDRYSVSTCGWTFSVAPGNSAERPS